MEKKSQLLTPEDYNIALHKATELASLIGSVSLSLSFAQKRAFLEKLSQETRGKFRGSSRIAKQIAMVLESSKEGNHPLTGSGGQDNESSREDLLDEKLSETTLDRIAELYNSPGVAELLEKEMQSREDKFKMLNDGDQKLPEIDQIQAKIDKGENGVIDLKIKSFTENRSLTAHEQSIIKRIQEGVAGEKDKKAESLNYFEPAMAYRLRELKNYKTQLNTKGYIITPSRKKLIDEIKNKLLLGQHILLHGPTGTGKTALAIEALTHIEPKIKQHIQEINGSGLADELNASDSQVALQSAESIVISGHSGITPSEFMAKPIIKGQIETGTQLGKLLLAFTEGKIPIIDEIDLIPNEVLMRIKHLFEKKPRSFYSPQEDSNKRLRLLSTKVIATANIKSEKHANREDLDPAIMRLFGLGTMYVNYLPEEELYDVALTKLMKPEGYIDYVGSSDLGSKTGSLGLLIQAMKEIENSYMGHGEGENLITQGKTVNKQFLKKSILEMGQFTKLFNGRDGSQLFADFLRGKIIDFIASATEKNDMLILLKIFSSKGLITKSDTEILKSKTSLTTDEITKNLLKGEYKKSDDELFVDPYQLAMFDPYKIRNIDQLNLLNADSLTFNALKSIMQKYTPQMAEEKAGLLLDVLDPIIEQYKQTKKIEIGPETQDEILNSLKELNDLGSIVKLGEVWGKDVKEYLPQDMPKIVEEKKSVENLETTNATTFIQNQYNERIEKLKNSGEYEIDGGTINLNDVYKDSPYLSDLQNQIKNLKSLTNQDIQIISKDKIDNKINIEIIEIKGEKFVSLEISEDIRNMKLSDTYLGGLLANHKNKNTNWFPKIDFNKTIDDITQSKGYTIWQQSPQKENGEIIHNIEVLKVDEKKDILRMTAGSGGRMMSIIDNIILTELIKNTMGSKFVDFQGEKADGDKAGFELVRKNIEEIESKFGISFSNFSQNNYIFRDYSIYMDQKNNIKGYLRGSARDSDNSVFGGVCSLDLSCFLDYRGVYLAVRSLV